MKRIVFLNGEFLAENEAGLSVFNPGFLSGLGLFETMRSCQNKIIYFEEHLKRIQKSAKLIHIGLLYPMPKIKTLIRDTIKRNSLKDASVRLTLWKGNSRTGILIFAKEYQPYPLEKYKKGFRAMIAQLRQNENSLLARIKTTSRLLYELSFQEAKNKGYDEAIILNNRGYITEGTRSNIFFVKDNAVFTPGLECGCLEGITRRVIFDLAKRYNLEIYTCNFTAQDLCAADEAFLTNSLMGIMPLTHLEKGPIGQGLAGAITKFLGKKYNLLLKNAT